MDALACVTQILEECGCEIECSRDDLIVFIARSIKPRICAIISDGIAHAQLLTVVSADLLEEAQTERIRQHIAASSDDMEFIGRLQLGPDCVYWRIDFTLCSNYESNREMLDSIFTYAYDDLCRLDVIFGLQSSNMPSLEIRKHVADVGLVYGRA